MLLFLLSEDFSQNDTGIHLFLFPYSSTVNTNWRIPTFFFYEHNCMRQVQKKWCMRSTVILNTVELHKERH